MGVKKLLIATQDKLETAKKEISSHLINEMNENLEAVSNNLSKKICDSCAKNFNYTDDRIVWLNKKMVGENVEIRRAIKNVRNKLDAVLILALFNSICILGIIIYLSAFLK